MDVQDGPIVVDTDVQCRNYTSLNGHVQTSTALQRRDTSVHPGCLCERKLIIAPLLSHYYIKADNLWSKCWLLCENNTVPLACGSQHSL